MRITQNVSSSSTKNYLSDIMSQISKTQAQASSGKRIQSISDDPQGAAQAMAYRSTISSIDQYSKNADDATARFSLIDNALDSIGTSLTQAKQDAITGATTTTDDTTRQGLATDIQSLIDSIVNETNSSYNNNSLFGGNVTNKDPITIDSTGAAQYNGDDGTKTIAIGDSSKVTLDVNAKTILNMNGATDSSLPDVVTLLTSLKKDIVSGDSTAIQTDMDQLDKSYNNVLEIRGREGSKAALVSSYQTRLTDTKTTLSTSLSNVEDADYTETITQLQSEENVYQAALYSANSMSNLSLLNYLK